GKRQREEVVVSGSSIMFNDGLKNIKGFKEGEELGVAYIEVGCGCTSRKYGDLVGILRVYATGQFVIRCQCWERCEEEEGRMTPEEFEKHGRKEGPRDWKKNIWIHLDYEKVPLKKTQLLQYYKQSSNVANCNSSSKYVFHRDEFLVCYVCGNHRR
ncbi:Protein ULTRAPETALA 1-like protein, partial [Quillaja saponaria]